MNASSIHRAVVSFVILAVSLSGCTMVGPDFVTPEAPVAKVWLETKDTKVLSEPDDHSDWWTNFNDPVLDSLIETAFQQNLPLQIFGMRILESRAALGIAVGNLYPQLQQFRTDATVNQTSDHVPGGALGDTFFGNYVTGFDVAWEIDVWGRFRRGIESADAELIATVANYDDLVVTLTAEVARAYVLIRTFEERLEIAKENVTIQKRSFHIAEVRFKHGLVTELDVTQAHSLLRNTQASIPALEIGQRQAKHALSVLLGLPPYDLHDMLDGPQLIPTAPATVAVGIPTDLLRRRPDIRVAELQAAAQSARIGIAASDLYPAFSLFGFIGLQSSDSSGITSNALGQTFNLTNDVNFGDLFDTDSLTYSIGPSVRWPFFNYGRLKNNVRVQDARFQQLVVNYQNTVLEAARESEDALIAFLRAQDQAEFLADSVEAAERSVQLSLIQYRDGVVDYQRVLDSQEFLVQQADRWTATRGDVALNLISTYKALGGGWQIRQGRDFFPAHLKETMQDRTDWGELLSPDAVDDQTPRTDRGLVRSPDF